ncbi:ubiquinol-cytochrome C chaperone family protein [Helicobacter pylori]|uniref:ubiquinol-cytochrome C chaperone family protein n=1 Tax=Helicobacter pylori TaxID=210 RepID=UPI000A7D8394|nr:ubiquinol-cytochrome C chaperone family protein [Helicobacter pylori]
MVYRLWWVKSRLKKTLGILAGPIGWVITGALVSVNLAGPAYRVTVPACVLVATLRKKLKAEQEAEQARLKAEQAEQEAKQKAQQEADKKKEMWYLAIISIVLIGLAVLAVFYMKGKHHSSNDPSNNQTSGVEKFKNPSHKN